MPVSSMADGDAAVSSTFVLVPAPTPYSLPTVVSQLDCTMNAPRASSNGRFVSSA